MQRNLSWMIGGPQGSGINVSAEVFARYAARTGLRIFANIEYHSNIMGEHSYYRVRLSDRDRHSVLGRVDVLVALDDETLEGARDGEFASHLGHLPGHLPGHLKDVAPGGVAIYDGAGKFSPSHAGRDDILLLGVPYTELLRQTLKEFGREGDATRLRTMTNVVATGASVFALGGAIEPFCEAQRAEFTGARAQRGEMNARAALLGYQFAARELDGFAPYDLRGLAAAANRPGTRPMLMRGTHACAIGKLKAGLQLQTYYPISPATDESVYLEAHQRDQNLLVVQAEDEIACFQMAIGAANAGARAATSTSGPGFALMVEGLGYAAMTEVGGPVVFLWQRGGPSTGLPTRQEQADLRFALHPGQGEFPHIVVAPADLQQIFDDSFEAFNWADRYHVPVVVLLDKYLATQYATLDQLKTEDLAIDRGPRFSATGAGGDDSAAGEYLRYAFTATGVTPRAFPGEEGGIFWSTSDEHDPRGHITEVAANRIRMMEKRMGKLDLAALEIPSERKLAVLGPEDADATLVGWGSVTGSVLDAMDVLAREDGVRLNFVQVRLLRPFPVPEVADALGRSKRLIAVENNYSGQLAGLIREMTGIHIPQKVLKYDGRPFTEEELVEALRRVLGGDEARVHVSHHYG